MTQDSRLANSPPRDGAAAGTAPVHADYAKRRDDFIEEAAREERLERWLSHARLATFFLALALTWLALGTESISARWISLGVIAFAALVVVHDRVIRARDHSRRAAALYERGIARLEDRALREIRQIGREYELIGRA